MNQQLLPSLGLIAISVITGVIGQTVIKMGVSKPGVSEGVSGMTALIRMILRSPLVLLGLMLYGIGALSWIGALTQMDLSVAYPFLALNFVLVALSSRIFLGEHIPWLRYAGIAVICAGILLVARSAVGG